MRWWISEKNRGKSVSQWGRFSLTHAGLLSCSVRLGCDLCKPVVESSGRSDPADGYTKRQEIKEFIEKNREQFPDLRKNLHTALENYFEEDCSEFNCWLRIFRKTIYG